MNRVGLERLPDVHKVTSSIDSNHWLFSTCVLACSNQNITSCVQPIFDYIKRTIDYVCQSDCSPCPENATICNTISGIFEPANVTECIGKYNLY